MLGLKKIDWYIIKKFMATFFIAILLIIGRKNYFITACK